MKSIMLGIAALCVLLTFITTGCSGSSNSSNEQSSAVLSSIAVTPANFSLSMGTTQQFTATGTYADSSTKDLTSSVTWTSSDSAIADVDAAGLATGKAIGSVTITAELGNVTGSTTATVKAPVPESPFAFNPAGVFKPGYTDSGYGDAQNIGVKWTRQGICAFWFIIQPDLHNQIYDFSLYDQQYGPVPPGIKILANIAPQSPMIDEGYCIANSYMPVDTDKYSAFVKATVERYDGDGTDDMPGLTNPIKYWQVGNEPNSLISGFADLQRITYAAIKEACPDCTVLIGGVPGMPPVDQYIHNFDQTYKPILDALDGKYVDVMDFHWYGNATGDYKGAKQVYDHIRSVLNADGFPSLPFWITEMGSYSGDPGEVAQVPFDYPFQTEQQQALDYFKRFVYPLSFGVKKIFPAFGLMEGFKYDGSYFDFTGLIYDGWGNSDPGLGVKKLGYYTYKKMTEMLEGADWNNIQTIQASNNVYIFKFTKTNAPVYIAWWDYFDEPSYVTGNTKTISITGVQGISTLVTEAVPKFSTGRDVTDYASAFNKQTVPVSNGTITLTLNENPVFVEVLQ